MTTTSTNAWLTAQTPLIIGHRGASAAAPENTLAAFALAVAQGADGVELDVQLSADGQPVIIHDGTIDRVTNGTGRVSALTVAELQAYALRGGERIPTLAQLFARLGAQTLYNIELKEFSARDRGLETAVAACVREFGLAERVLISSFNPLAIRRARRCFDPGVPLALIRQPGLQSHAHRLVHDMQADHPHHTLVDEAYVAWARARAYRIHVWTVDDPQIARRLVKLGVHGVITNAPRRLRDYLEAEAAAP
jgi:glycerophosphoryl diester phosphodiesterase